MTKVFFDRWFYLIWIVSSLILSLVPLYSLGYLVFVIGASRKLRVLKSFDSYFSNSILSFFILVSSIMVTGVFTSYLNIPNYAIINTFFALLFTIIIIKEQLPGKTHKTTGHLAILKWSDVAGLISGTLIPILIIAIHVTSLGVDGALFRIVNADGWDNTSHLNLLQATSDNKNYFYSSSPVHKDGVELSNNYPQGWHLAMSSLVDGIAPNSLNPVTFGLSTTFVAYLSIVFLWYILACFTLLKLSWGLLTATRRGVLRGILFIIALQFPAITLFLPSITSGFINYLALMPPLLVIVALSHQLLSLRNRDHLWACLLVIVLLSSGIGLTWILPLPALCLLVLLIIGVVGVNRFNLSTSKLPALFVFALVSLSVALYMLLLLKDVGVSHLFVGNGLPKYFPGQTTVLVSILVICMYYGALRKYPSLSTTLITVIPFILLVFGAWLLSYLHSDTLGYYNAKILGILCVVVYLFTVSIVVHLSELSVVSRDGYESLVKIIVASGITGLLVVLSSQVIDMRMLQRSQYILTAPERSFASKWVYTDESIRGQGQLLIERADILAAPSSAMLFNRVSISSAEKFLAAASPSSKLRPKGSSTCLLYIYYDDNMSVLPSKEEIYKALSDCLRIRSEANLSTKILLPESARSIYEKISTYNASLIYYPD